MGQNGSWLQLSTDLAGKLGQDAGDIIGIRDHVRADARLKLGWDATGDH